MVRMGGGKDWEEGQNIGTIETVLIVLRAAYLHSRRAYHCHTRILALEVAEIRELCS